MDLMAGLWELWELVLDLFGFGYCRDCGDIFSDEKLVGAFNDKIHDGWRCRPCDRMRKAQ